MKFRKVFMSARVLPRWFRHDPKIPTEAPISILALLVGKPQLVFHEFYNALYTLAVDFFLLV